MGAGQQGDELMAGRHPSGDPIVTVEELIEALKTWPSDTVLYVGSDTWLGAFENCDPIWDGRDHPLHK